MKHVKHCLFAAAATLLLLLALGGPAFAYTITVNPGDQPTTGHSYKAYQIFTGTFSNGEIHVTGWSNDQFGSRVVEGLINNNNSFSDAVKAKINDSEHGPKTTDTAANSAGKVAYVLESIQNNEKDAKLFAKIVKKAIEDDTTNSPQPIELTLGTNGLYTANVEFTGYYLIVDTASIGGTNDFVSDPILTMVIGDVVLSSKGNVPSVQKKVNTSVNQNDVANGDWQDTADYHINDKVPFQLTGTLPSDFDQYNTYAYTFTDNYSIGLSPIISTIKVYVDKDGKTDTTNDKELVSSGYTTSDDSASRTFTVSFENLKNVATGISKDSKIIVEYNATLNENAVFGTSASNANSGNPNTVKLTYSNNPIGSGTGITPPDTVYVFTYQLDVDKVNRDNHNDKGQNAEFILYSKSKNKWAQVTNGNISGWTDEQNATKLDTGSTGTFTVKGLDAGEYTLKETKEPTGFLMPSNRKTKFTITANLTETLDATSATAADAISNLKINNSADNANTSTGQVKLVIENSRSGSLPSTGSMGMFIMIGVGICLMAGAGIYLLKNRKKA